MSHLGQKPVLKIFLLTVAAALWSVAVFAATPVAWRNLDEPHHLGGRVASAGYLRGKVVLVDCRDYGSRSSAEAMQRMEEAWNIFKMKQFVLIGSHRGAAGKEKIRRIVEGLDLTYPIYADAGLADVDNEPRGKESDDGYLYVLESTGKVVYRGVDDRRAFGVVAGALMAQRGPQTPKQWKHYIDFDIDVLPGRALLELEEFRKAFPKEAAAYDEAYARLSSDEEVKRLAKLERLARQAKDYDFKDAAARRLSTEKVDLAIRQFADLKASARDVVSQEAKNCIAELMWTSARLGGK